MIHPTSTIVRPTPADLEAYLAGDLDDGPRARVERAIAADATLERWIQARRAEREAFLYDPRRRAFDDLVAEATATPSATGAGGFRWWGSALAAASAVMAIAVIAGPEISHPGARAPAAMRTKGGLTVRAAVRAPDATVRALRGGEAVRPGDRLRLLVEDPLGGYVTVLLEEDGGDVSVLYRPEELGRLPPGRHALPGSLELDDALGRERIYVIASSERPDVERWQRQIEAFRSRRGFDHGWLPEGRARIGVLEYTKVR